MRNGFSDRLRGVIRRVASACVILAVFLAGAARGAVVYAPPEDAPDAAAELKGVEGEMDDGNYAAAARRLDVLLAGRSDHLVHLAEGTLTSVSAWAGQLPAERRASLAAEYARAFGPAAKRASDSLRERRDAGVDEWYALARRYPMTPAGGEALAEAGDRALALGDLPAAQAFYELGRSAGVVLDEGRAGRLEEVRRMNAGVKAPAPADLGKWSNGEGGLPTVSGPLPFDAAWFGGALRGQRAKFFPAAYDGHVLLASWNGVTMLRAEGGEAVWASPNPRPPARFSTLESTSSGRGGVFAPAVLADVHGRAAVVIVRQPGPDGAERCVLRGLGGADGRTLWSTIATDPREDVSYAGLPAVAGRYVYSVAVRRTGPSTAELLLSALDVTTGAALWQTPIGSVAEQGDGRLGGRKNVRSDPLYLDGVAELSEPAVAGDLVIVSPNCGAVIAAGRFDGKVRWVGIYRPSDAPDARGLGAKPLRWATRDDAQLAMRLRYKSTPVVCGDVVVAMPQDAPAVFAFDRAGGRRAWDSDLQPAEAFGLAGAAGNMAVLCGTTLTGLDASGTGRRKWRYVPPRGTALTGPAVVVGPTVIAPTTDGFVQLDAADGKERRTHAVPDFRALVETTGGRAAVTEAGAARAFGVPEW